MPDTVLDISRVLAQLTPSLREIYYLYFTDESKNNLPRDNTAVRKHYQDLNSGLTILTDQALTSLLYPASERNLKLKR